MSRYNDLLKMDHEVYAAELEDAAYEILDDPTQEMLYLCQMNSHVDLHCKSSVDSLMDRVLHNNIPAASSFAEETSAKECISDLVAYSAPDIASWFYKDRSEFSRDEDFWKLVISQKMGAIGKMDPVGYGLDHGLREYETTACCIVLQRDTSGLSPYGFYLSTAYPDILNKEASFPTGREYRIEDIVNEKPFFKDDMDKLACLYKYRDGPFSVSYLPAYDNNTPKCKLYHRGVDERITIQIPDDGKTKIMRLLPSGSTSITQWNLFNEYPKIHSVLTEMLSDRERIKNGINIEVDKERFQVRRDVR